MKERPIIFNGEMVRAILDGRKTQTRRVVKPQPQAGEEYELNGDGTYSSVACPFGKIGNRLWLRETFVLENTYEYNGAELMPDDGRPVQVHEEYKLIPHYRATEPEPHIVSEDAEEFDDRTRWRPSIHMPRWASRCRIFLKRMPRRRV